MSLCPYACVIFYSPDPKSIEILLQICECGYEYQSLLLLTCCFVSLTYLELIDKLMWFVCNLQLLYEDHFFLAFSHFVLMSLPSIRIIYDLHFPLSLSHVAAENPYVLTNGSWGRAMPLVHSCLLTLILTDGRGAVFPQAPSLFYPWNCFAMHSCRQ